jgi:hypothetical protein
MNKVDSDKVKLLMHKIGLKHHLQDSVINKIVNSPYRFARETIVNIKLDGIEDEVEFNKLKTNFIFAHLGKLYTTYNVYKKLLKQKDKLKEYHNLKQNKNEIE